jgi:hypothetical protein
MCEKADTSWNNRYTIEYRIKIIYDFVSILKTAGMQRGAI